MVGGDSRQGRSIQRDLSGHHDWCACSILDEGRIAHAVGDGIEEVAEMTKSSIKARLQRAAKGAEFITRGDIKRALGCGNDQAARITKDMDYIQFGRTHQYDVDEVAQRIYESTVKVVL